MVPPSRSRGLARARGLRSLARSGAAALILSAHPAAAQAPGEPPTLSVTLVPDSLALQPGRTARTVVVLRNLSPEPLRGLRLSWFTNSRLDVREEPRAGPSGDVLAPGAARVVGLTIVGREQAERRGTVIVRADYRRGAAGTPDVVLAPLAVAPAALEAPEDVLDVEVSSSLATLTERQPGQLFLVLKNKADVPVTIDSSTVTAPSFLSVGTLPRVTIGARSVAFLPVTITARNAVRPGKHQVLIDLAARWSDGGGPARHIVLAREVEVGVLGESVILKALGVPSFLVLPGFLMVLTFGALWKRRVLRPDTAPAEFSLSPTDAEFWLLAITLSGLMALLYPGISGGRDYLDFYGVRDVATVWMLSVFVVGLGAYVAVALLQTYLHRRRTPAAGDDEATILEKLGRQGLGLRTSRVEVTIGGAKARAFALQPRRSDGGAIWVGPEIRWAWKGGASPTDIAVRARIDELVKRDDARQLARVLREASGKRDVDVHFEALDGGQISRPYKAELKDVAWDGSDSILEKV